MKRIACIVVLALCGVSLAAALSPRDMMNYQGVLRGASGQPLNGSFSMVFRLFSAEVGGDEILVNTQAVVNVVDGLFNVTIGGVGGVGTGIPSDGSGPGGYGYLPRVFGDYRDVFLEVEVNGEILSPRTRIVSAAYALNTRYVNGVEVTSAGAVSLYVDPVNGNDDNSGIFVGAPKRTVEAALKRLPVILGGPVTVYLADGTYNESVVVDRRIRIGEYMLTFQGNEATPDAVTFDGQDVLGSAFGIADALELRGIRFRGYVGEAVAFQTSPGSVVANCRFDTADGSGGSYMAISAVHSTLTIMNTDITGAYTVGISALKSTVRVYDTEVAGINGVGLWADAGSDVKLAGTINISGNGDVGVRSSKNSSVQMGAGAQILLNTAGDLEASWQGVIGGYGAGTCGPCVTMDPQSLCEP